MAPIKRHPLKDISGGRASDFELIKPDFPECGGKK
jgi:hypothetical protein